MRLFGKRNSEAPLRIYYASDIHGTEVLWRKFLNAPRYYDVQVLVMGGDIAGKSVVPLVRANGGWSAHLFGREEHASSEEDLAQLENRIRGNGMYPYRTTAEELAEIAELDEEARESWFEGVMVTTFREWMSLADERLEGSGVRCFVMPGNDDPPGLEEPIVEAKNVESCDEHVVEFAGYSMLSLGYSNQTPWNSPRELDEDELYRRIAELARDVPDLSRSIFNLHVPPYDSGLDTAAELDDELRLVLVGNQPHMIPVGSSAVRKAIEEFQPLAALHGHIHESPGATRIGRTLCVNPGSDYASGRISGCLINLRGDKVTHQFVDG